MKKKRIYLILILIIILVIVIVVAISKSKYVLKEQTLHVQNSEMFYFESDLLSLEQEEYTYSDWDGQSEYTVKFSLYNYEDELRINSQDINYTISASIELQTEDDEITTYINGIETANGKMMPDGKQEEKVEIKINSKNKTNIILNVEVNSTSPYTKKLSGKFNINPKTEQEYIENLEQSEQTDYAKLLIKTNSFSGNLKIAYNSAKTEPDMSNYILENVEPVLIENNNYYIEITLASNSNYQIDFIKKDTANDLSMGNDISSSDIVVGY